MAWRKMHIKLVFKNKYLKGMAVKIVPTTMHVAANKCKTFTSQRANIKQ